jgi:hypothetical protein
MLWCDLMTKLPADWWAHEQARARPPGGDPRRRPVNGERNRSSWLSKIQIGIGNYDLASGL